MSVHLSVSIYQLSLHWMAFHKISYRRLLLNLWKSGGKRKGGRPKLRLLDGIENGLKLMGVKRQRKKVEDKSAWALILKEALGKL
jgi:hypothetical protein